MVQWSLWQSYWRSSAFGQEQLCLTISCDLEWIWAKHAANKAVFQWQSSINMIRLYTFFEFTNRKTAFLSHCPGCLYLDICVHNQSSTAPPYWHQMCFLTDFWQNCNASVLLCSLVSSTVTLITISLWSAMFYIMFSVLHSSVLFSDNTCYGVFFCFVSFCSVFTVLQLCTVFLSAILDFCVTGGGKLTTPITFSNQNVCGQNLAAWSLSSQYMTP